MPARNSVHFIVQPDENVEIHVDGEAASVNLDLAGAFAVPLGTTVSITFQPTPDQTAQQRLREWGLAFARVVSAATADPDVIRLSADETAGVPLGTMPLTEVLGRAGHPSYAGLGSTPEGGVEISGMTYMEFSRLVAQTKTGDAIAWYWRGERVTEPPSLDAPSWSTNTGDPRSILTTVVETREFHGRLGPGPDGAEERIP